LAREKIPWASALSSLLLGGIADVRGDHSPAAGHFRKAEEAARASGMRLFTEAARFRGALALGDATSVLAVRELESELRAEGIRDPARFCSLLAPGVHSVEAQAPGKGVAFLGRGTS
jgi:hypothetical protein